MSKKTLALAGIICFVVSLTAAVKAGGGQWPPSVEVSPQTAGTLLLAQTFPASLYQKEEAEKPAKAETEKKPEPPAKEEVKTADNSHPQVIIYHTHSSESYQPYTESNFHKEGEKGTVREVGDVMAAELNRLGIGVVHDKTIHDRPSYNLSYDRSMETITALQRDYPDAEVIIDLHRDAAAYTGGSGETIDIKGTRTAIYKLVIGQNNDNYAQLKAFAAEVNETADRLYPGFAGAVLEKEYRYNEYIADKYLLLEVGNNQNTIEEARATGKYFAHVLAEILEEE